MKAFEYSPGAHPLTRDTQTCIQAQWDFACQVKEAKQNVRDYSSRILAYKIIINKKTGLSNLHIGIVTISTTSIFIGR
jgi:hypothetical protein